MASRILGCIYGDTISRSREVIIRFLLSTPHRTPTSTLGLIIKKYITKVGKFNKGLSRWYGHWIMSLRLKPGKFRLAIRRKALFPLGQWTMLS